MTMCRLLGTGIVVATEVKSYTGKYLYSDFAGGEYEKNCLLNNLAQIPVIGIVAGAFRVILGIIHTLGHLLAALITQKKGHLYHAGKGVCESIRGLIEMLPIVGRIFAWDRVDESEILSKGKTSVTDIWMMKMYNPNSPDGLDRVYNNWDNWKSEYPHLYYKA
ncbi:MAG: hypothetical protein K1000chlam4_00351 [Chlamydiae bacterium]|nr:hypothetical protein [Chlamydiota bacterium]